MPTREKRFLPTLIDMLDARSKTILEAWHTDINGDSFGKKEQNEAGNFAANRPFVRYQSPTRAKKKKDGVTVEDADGNKRTVGSSNAEQQTWPAISSISFDDYNKSNGVSKPRSLEEMWFSGNKVQLNSGDSDAVGRTNIEDSLDNFFGGQAVERRDYKVRFLSALDGAFANVPSPRQVRSQGEKGFNVGQVKPFSFGRYIFGDKREIDFESGKIAASLARISGWEQQLIDQRPGANRINIVFNIKTDLDKLLRQNLLMPSDMFHAPGVQRTLSFEKALEEGQIANLNDDTFTKLYLKNRSVLHNGEVGDAAFGRKPAGTIGGRAVADLQGPEYDKNSNFTANDEFTVFKFEEDAERANTYTQDRGFIDNVAGNIFVGSDQNGRSNIASLLPAVDNDFDTNAGTQDKTTLLKTLEKADSQAFPFMFETVNKGGAIIYGGTEYKQYCYLQATLQSLNESYAPSWSSKHFFGRTEQIHTYTMTDRTIDLGFVVFATEIRRLQNLYERITWLAQQTYASYDDSFRQKGGPLIRMTIGDMFSNLTGFIRSLSFDWSYLGPGGKWEITQGLRIPMACSVQMNFTVIHDDMPDRNFALYPGPLLRDDGIIGERGRLSTQVDGGPLIPTTERQTVTYDRNVTLTEAEARQVNFSPKEVAELKRNKRRLNFSTAGELPNENGPDIAYANNRKEQYIDQLNRNKSLGVDNIY